MGFTHHLGTLHQARVTSPPRSSHSGFPENHGGHSVKLWVLPAAGALAPPHLRTYWALSRMGPKSALRTHMGRPVWTASNHFTTISPGGRRGGGGEGAGGEQGQKERPVMLRAGHRVASASLQPLPGVSSAQSQPVLGPGALGLRL